MVLFLACDVGPNGFAVGRADRKDAVSRLPGEVVQSGSAFFDPRAGDALELFDPVGLGDCAAQSRQEMYVIFDTANEGRGAIEPLGNGSQVGMHFRTENGIAEERDASLGGEDKMNVNG